LELFCTAAYIGKITDGNLEKTLVRQEFYRVILEVHCLTSAGFDVAALAEWREARDKSTSGQATGDQTAE
jgi:hypothetical protein